MVSEMFPFDDVIMNRINEGNKTLQHVGANDVSKMCFKPLNVRKVMPKSLKKGSILLKLILR